MRIVQAVPDRTRRSHGWKPLAGRTARVERAALLATSIVVAFGVLLTWHGQQLEMTEGASAAANAQPLNLARLSRASDLAPILKVFEEPVERAAAAEAVYRRVKASEEPAIAHVGALASVTIPADRVRADARLVVLNERLRVKPESAAVTVFTSRDIAALKADLVVRTGVEHRDAIALALVLFLGSFWLAHAVRAARGRVGDPMLLPVLQLLSGLGLAAMVGLRDPLRDTIPAMTFATGIAAGAGLFTMAAFIDFDSPRIRRAVLLPLAAAVLLATALVLFGGGPAGSGARVNLLGVQPVEAIRLLVVFSLAAYFARRWQFLRELSEAAGPSRQWLRHVRLPRWQDVRPLAVTLGTLLTFFFLQKDLGPVLVLSGIFLGLYGVARGRVPLVVGGGVALAAGLAAGYLLGVPATVTRRVAMWLDPWDNGLAGGDQIAHALWAFSTGGLSGVGPGMGDPQLIPAGHTDLVLAAIAEELGFVGVVVVIGCFALLVHRLLRIALRAPSDFSCFLVTALCLAIATQAIVITAGILGLLPLAGLVTPFVSFGRSAMLSNFAAIGICGAVAQRLGSPREPFVAPLRATGWTFASAALLIVAWAAVVQVASADAFATRGNLARQADGEYRYQYNPRLTAAARRIVRGTIYDRSGLPLATSRPEQMQPFVQELERLGVAIPADCVEGATGGRRCYPLGGLAFHVLGDADFQTNWAASNSSYIERDFESRLKGFDDAPRTVRIRDVDGRLRPVVVRDYRELLPLVRHRYRPGQRDVQRLLSRDRDVRVSLDARLQIRVAQAVAAAARAGSGKGAAVLLDADSGHLLASVSYPWPDTHGQRSTPRDVPASPEPLLDRARYGLYPPGSTFKLVTAAAAFRAEPHADGSTFQCVRLADGRVGGHVHGESRPVRDDALDRTPHGRVDLRRALVFSCNAYFAQLAERVGAAAIGDTASAAQIAAARAPMDRNLPLTLAHAGYGQGQVVASPLRMARVAAAIANGGMLHDVRTTLAPAGPEPSARRWIPPRAAEQLGRYMREAVTTGTARALARHAGRIAGKTGTAEVQGAASHAWFVGFAPFERRDRKVAFAVLLEHAGYGGRAAASLAGDIVAAASARP